MSLRVRLALVVVGLAAVGLLVSDLVMYTSLRSFLVSRLDQQLAGSVGAIGGALRLAAEGGPGSEGDVFRGPGPAGGPPVLLPPGTYGELRGSDGRVLSRVQFDYGETSLPAPELPATLRASALAGEAFTVPATDGSSLSYRARAFVAGDGSGGSMIITVPLTEVVQTLRRLVVMEVVITVSVLMGLAALSWWVVRRGLRPLERMGGTAAAIAAGDLSARVESADPRTEVGRLGLSLNAMLAQIERAFAQRLASEERLRRFLADASHELRTPLTSIRGYAELFRRGARQRPEDLAASMRRIEEEAARMGILVEEMLTLARLDQARQLETAPVDLALIAADAAADARAADPERPITVLPSAPIVVAGDEARLRQVASNLLANALRHTPRGSPVEVAVGVEDDRAVLAVADRGAGLPPEEVERVFEPFYRSDPARARDHGGTGLGLSIVAAIAAAHGGFAEVRGRKGGGSLFRVVLPVASAAGPRTLTETSQPEHRLMPGPVGTLRSSAQAGQDDDLKEVDQ